jgi:proteasome lid subunit RPN8/RPN11
MLRIKKNVMNAVFAHAARELPYEACGYLAGKNSLVSKHYELTNVDKSAEHFSMDPKEQFAAIKDMRRLGLKLRGVYHSHPVTPARPSAADIRLAHDPDIIYVIVSLADNKSIASAFSIRKGEVKLVPVEILDKEERGRI